MGNVNSHAVKIEELRPGDHIFIWDRTHWPLSYQHHGIVWDSGDSVKEVHVCHVWTPLEGFRQAQTDSHFQVSTLEQFLYHRSVDDLRVVEYNRMFQRQADQPEIVLARCKLLLGRGRGDYNPITQNCEHAARWCKTGYQWCSQTLTPGHGTVPFEDKLRKEDVLALQHQLAAIKFARSMNNGMKHRVKVNARTLFWLDSFSSEFVNVRQALARQVFKWPPVISTIRLKRIVWSCPIDMSSSHVHLKLNKASYRGESWLRHVEFAATFLKTPVRSTSLRT